MELNMKSINIKNVQIEDMISEVYGIPFENLGEHPLVEKINKLSMEYLVKKIVDTYGDEYYMGCSSGGFTYNMECDQIVRETEDGDEEYNNLK